MLSTYTSNQKFNSTPVHSELYSYFQPDEMSAHYLEAVTAVLMLTPHT